MANLQLIFGIHPVRSALRNDPAHVEILWIDRGRNDARMQELIALAQSHDVEVRAAETADLTRRLPGCRHQGVIARYRVAGPLHEDRLIELLEEGREPALLLVLDGVTDPHNLGACLRTAEAAGAQAVIAPKDRAVSLTPVVRKTAAGAAERLPFITVTNLARLLRALKARNVAVIGMADDAPDNVYSTDLSRPVALVLGGEGKGLRRLTRECCDRLVSLPMAGRAESLNVSVAAGVVLFEAMRQRRCD